MTELTKDVPLNWTERTQEAFDKLKLKIKSAPVLQTFHTDYKTVVTTDASTVAIGAVLEQDSISLQNVTQRVMVVTQLGRNIVCWFQDQADVHKLKEEEKYEKRKRDMIVSEEFTQIIRKAVRQLIIERQEIPTLD